MSIEKHLARMGIGSVISLGLVVIGCSLLLVRHSWPVSGYWIAGILLFMGASYLLGWIAGADKL